MIPAIGYMIGFYIITKMFALLLKRDDGRESAITLILAGITIFVAIIGIVILVSGEFSSLQ